MSLVRCCFLFFCCALRLAVAGPVLSEFMAENGGSVLDAEGDSSDWIEITNPEASAIDLAGWRLTDNPAAPGQWAFPAGTILPAGSQIVVFASGKNRADPAKELHTNFTLKTEGEYLALFPPEGAAATEFAPAFPAQRRDVSFGAGERALAKPLVEEGAAARLHVPTQGGLGNAWTVLDFDDSAWASGSTAVGYDDMTSDLAVALLGYWNFDQAAAPKTAVDASGRGAHATVIGSAKYTAAGEGRSGANDDRAMDFSGGGTAGLRVDAAATGAFDAAVQGDKLTVSLWCFGGPKQPAANAAFWFDNGSGTRTAMAHLPWTDQQIYFDTAGCCGGDTRIAQPETDPSKWRGQWNHYVFLKDGPRKEIWQNGRLWHEGEGAAPLTPIRAVWLGSGVGGSSSYPGKLDEIAVWASALSADDIQLLGTGAGPQAVGGYRPKIRTDLLRQMQHVSASAYLRAPFEIADGPLPDRLALRVRYDDGFTAYLNGVEIARREALHRPKGAVLVAEAMDLSAAARHLRLGRNVLAIHGRNASASDADFLLTAELSAGQALTARYFPRPTPGAANNLGVAGFVADTAFSRARGYYDAPMPVTISSATPGASLILTTDGSAPSETNGETVAGSNVTINVATTRVIRALATKPDFAPSAVATQTYLFLADVARQPNSQPGYPETWGVYGAYGPRQGQPVPADYEMDPEVVDATAEGHSVREALRSLPALCLTTSVADMFDAKTGLYPNSATQGARWVRSCSAEFLPPDGAEGFQIDAGVRIHGGLSRQHWHARKHSFRLHFRREFGPPKLHQRLFQDTRVTEFNELTLRASSTDGWSVEDAQPWTRRKATYMRDAWMKDTQQTLGHACGHSRYVHVFLNGLYWGQYNLAERTEAVWQAANFGGDPDEYDIIKDVGEVEQGSKTIWNQMMALATSGLASDAAYNRLQGRDPDGRRDPDLPVYLHLESLIDYMILHIYAGAIDWPNHNWWAARRRGAESQGFRFFTWDQEISNISLTITNTYTNEAFAAVATPDSPAFLYSKLRANPSFRAHFTQRVVELTSAQGLLTPAQNSARWTRRQAEIDQSIVAESARWGDSRQTAPLTRATWLTEMAWMKNVYWRQIHATAIKRFRAVGLYPTETPLVPPAVELAPAAAVVIFEIHYHPANEAEEFLELTNTSPTLPVFFGGGRVSGAVDFVFPNGHLIPPAGRVVLARDRAAFAARYGVGRAVIGEFAGQLSNDGEWLFLLDPAGAGQAAFRYDDDTPWPVEADGQDRSLVFAGHDPANPAHWRPSAVAGGTPGADEATPWPREPEADADGDGVNALLEFFLGTSESDAAAGPTSLPRFRWEGSAANLSLTRSVMAAGFVAFEWQASANLLEWSPLALEASAATAAGDFETLTYRLPAGGPRFLRLKVRMK